jgi:mono/diheme cytochrome c family protein
MRTLLALMLVGCSGSGNSEEAKGPGDPVLGAAIYKIHCTVCHQKNGTGRTPQGANLGGSFVGKTSVLGRPDETLLGSIKRGKTGPLGAMPPWGGVLDEKARRDVLAYIRATFGGAKPPP